MIQLIFLSQSADLRFQAQLADALAGSRSSHRLVLLPPQPAAYPEISAHPDIFLCPLPCSLIAAPELSGLLKQTLGQAVLGLPTLFGQSSPGLRYPESARYNALICGPYLIHNPRCTDPVLLHTALQSGLSLLPIRQGYARCSALPVGDHALITADGGIRTAAKRKNIEVLLIRPGYVRLPGYPYGFLGGAAGSIGDEVWFHGDLSRHPDSSAIEDFILHHGLHPRWNPSFPLTDIGSILTFSSEEISSSKTVTG